MATSPLKHQAAVQKEVRQSILNALAQTGVIPGTMLKHLARDLRKNSPYQASNACIVAASMIQALTTFAKEINKEPTGDPQ